MAPSSGGFVRTAESKRNWEGGSRDLDGYRLYHITKMLWMIASYQAVDIRALFFSTVLEMPCVDAKKRYRMHRNIWLRYRALRKSDYATVRSEIPDYATLTSGIPDYATVPSEIPDYATVPSEIPDYATVPSEIPDYATVPSEIPDYATVPSEIPDSATVRSEILDYATVPSEIPDYATVPSEIPDYTTVPSEVPDFATVPSEITCCATARSEIPKVFRDRVSSDWNLTCLTINCKLQLHRHSKFFSIDTLDPVTHFRYKLSRLCSLW